MAKKKPGPIMEDVEMIEVSTEDRVKEINLQSEIAKEQEYQDMMNKIYNDPEYFEQHYQSLVYQPALHQGPQCEVVAERPADASCDEGELEPWAVHVNDGNLYIIDGREPCCVLKWPLGARAGQVVVGTGSTLNGVNTFADIIDIAIDANGDLHVLDGHHGRIVKIHDGVGVTVGEGQLTLNGTRALFVG